MTNFVACDTINTIGTSFQGTVKTTYDNLVEVFGEPTAKMSFVIRTQ